MSIPVAAVALRHLIDPPARRRVALPALDEISRGDIAVSFEFFPPKTPAIEAQLRHAIRRLAPLRPAFMSVTYGAGGSTRAGTHAIVKSIQTETGVPAAAHLTC